MENDPRRSRLGDRPPGSGPAPFDDRQPPRRQLSAQGSEEGRTSSCSPLARLPGGVALVSFGQRRMTSPATAALSLINGAQEPLSLTAVKKRWGVLSRIAITGPSFRGRITEGSLPSGREIPRALGIIQPDFGECSNAILGRFQPSLTASPSLRNRTRPPMNGAEPVSSLDLKSAIPIIVHHSRIVVFQQRFDLPEL